MNTNYIQSVKDFHKHQTTKVLIRQLLKAYNYDYPNSTFEEIKIALLIVEDENIIFDKHRAQVLDDTLDLSINELDDREIISFLALYPDPRYLIKLDDSKLTDQFKSYWQQIKSDNYDYIIDVLTAMQQRIDLLNKELSQHHKNSPEYNRSNLHIKHCKSQLKQVRDIFIKLDIGNKYNDI